MTSQFKQDSDLYPQLFKELTAFIESRTFHLPFGEIYHVPIDDLISAEEYNLIDQSILKLFNRGIAYTLLGAFFSKYYKIQRLKRKKSIGKTCRYIFKYFNLFRSMKKKDYVMTHAHLKSYPWIFVSKDLKLRLDGHHRSAVSRFLGKTELPAMVITHQSFKNQHISPQLAESLTKYPPIDLLPYTLLSTKPSLEKEPI